MIISLFRSAPVPSRLLDFVRQILQGLHPGFILLFYSKLKGLRPQPLHVVSV